MNGATKMDHKTKEITMTRRPLTLLAAILIVAALLGACSPSAATPVEGMSATLAMRTLVAERGMSLFATSTPTPPPTLAAGAPAAAEVAQPTPTEVPTVTPASKQNLYTAAERAFCNNRAEFIRDITVPDDTRLLPGEKFTKVWQFRNAGDCTWTTGYAVVFLRGEQMEGLSPRMLDFEVPPGQTANIALDLVAPTFPNYYQGHWIFTDEEGHQFGTGESGKNYFWVSIMVGSPGFSGSLISPVCQGGG